MNGLSPRIISTTEKTEGRQLVKQRLKATIHRFGRRSGLYELVRYSTRQQLRILCYHGWAVADEHEFMPWVFMARETFRRRLQTIADLGMNVVSLDEGVRRLHDGTLPHNSVVITIDDGFYSTLSVAAPIWEEFDYPVTLYVTTDGLGGPPIAELVTQYAFWRTDASSVDLTGLLPGVGLIDLENAGDRAAACSGLVKRLFELQRENRPAVARELCERLGVDYQAIEAHRGFSLMTREELLEIQTRGCDLQLHTHTHHLDGTAQQLTEELQANRRGLSGVVDVWPRHFCYPSGLWTEEMYDALRADGIRSATTCEAGLNDGYGNPYALNRYLDAEHLSDDEFRARLSGVIPWARGVVYETMRPLRAARHAWNRVGATLLPGRQTAAE